MNLDEKIKNLPEKSGVYIMRDSGTNIIYVGKAKVLKNRVRQYFSNSFKIPKVQAMVDNIADFEYIITLTEKDALSLESNLIKKYKPKYNILLKDDKASPYIKINLKHDYPTIEITRRIVKDGARYFGPYFNGLYVRDIVEVIKSAYKMRACPKGYYSKKRECLNYHINLCYAPCQKHISKEDYMQVVEKVIAFLTGRDDTAEQIIQDKMLQAVEAEEFERAINYRDQLEMLKKLKERNLADLKAGDDMDSFAYYSDGLFSAVSVNIVRGGKLMGCKNYSVTDASLTEQDALQEFITMYYLETKDVPNEILLPFDLDNDSLKEFFSQQFLKSVDITIPKIGTKKKIVGMAEENVKDYFEKSVAKQEREQAMTIGANEDLKKLLNLDVLRRIECYDISNISGVDKVASGVVSINGTMQNSEYRRYKIKTVEGSNDFACMAEVITRRLNRAKANDEKFNDLPDLILIDGGKGQLHYAKEAMNNVGIDIPMISLAEREEEIYTLYSSEPIVLDKSSYVLRLLIKIRDEAHRFAITYHRNLRKNRYNSELDKIKGVGEKKRKILLSAFEHYNDLKTADLPTLEAISGIDKRTAKAVYDYFNKEND